MEKQTNYEILNIDGTDYLTELSIKFKNRQFWTKPDPNCIISFIPGTVLKIHVNEGAEIEIGEDLILLESMKMENKVLSPVSGIVKKIHVSIGEKIPKDFLMIEIAN